LTGGGVVVDAKNGTMCAQNFTGIIFRLPLDHPYQNGDMVILNAVRINDKVKQIRYLQGDKNNLSDDCFCFY
jgi:hypothetical protein